MRLGRTRSRLLALLTLGAALALLAGCGSSGETGSVGDTIGRANGETTGSETTSGEATTPPLTETPALINWPYFGRVPERTHYLPDDKVDARVLDPPLKQAWSLNTHALIEFPPAIYHGTAYVFNKFGNAKAVRLTDRKVIWESNLHPDKGNEPVDVTAPTYYDGNVYAAFIDGTLGAGDADSGKMVWIDHLGAELESSPLGVGGLLYIGTNSTDLLALDAKTGKKVWSYNSPAEIKASPSYHHGVVFAADYQSEMFAVDAKTGKLKWKTNTSQDGGEGGFFSSPAIGFGRVYAARDDGTVFALDEETGKIDWSFPTGAAVYGSPALAAVPGTPPTVYIGSEDGSFYALDAATGKVRWKKNVGGPIPGTAAVIGHTVYTSSFKTQKTFGYDVLTHKRTFAIKQAGYTPMTSDGKRLYLVGYYTLIGLEPVSESQGKSAAKGSAKP